MGCGKSSLIGLQGFDFTFEQTLRRHPPHGLDAASRLWVPTNLQRMVCYHVAPWLIQPRERIVERNSDSAIVVGNVCIYNMGMAGS